MGKMEKVLNAINEAKKSSFWIRLIDKVSINKIDESNFYEIRFYLKFYVSDKIGLSEFDADIDAVIEAIDSFLLPELRKEFIVDITEINYFNDDVEIVLICENK